MILTATNSPLVTAADTATINANAVLSSTASSWAIDSLSVGIQDWVKKIETDCPPKHDTLTEYLYETKTVCDTIWDKRWVEATVVDGVQYYKQMDYMKNIHCADKEIWRPRIIVRLTDEQYRVLMRWLDPDSGYRTDTTGTDEQ